MIKHFILLIVLTISSEISADHLRIYSSQSKSLSEAWVERFKEQNPSIGVILQHFTSEGLHQQLQKEFQVGNSIADIILSDDPSLIEMLKAEQRLLTVEGIDTTPVYPQIVDSERLIIPTKLILVGIAHHESIPKPKSWKDIFNNALPLVWLSPDTSGPDSVVYAVLADQMGIDFLKNALEHAKQTSTNLSGCLKSLILEQTKIGIASYHAVVKAREEGITSVRFAIPQEGMIPLSEPMVILKTTQNPQDAYKWCQFVLSEAGQTIVTSLGWASCRSDIPTPIGYLSSKRFILAPVNYNQANVKSIYEKLKPYIKQK